MSRLLKIALREYLAFVRTVGFWLSMCVMPLGFATLIFLTTAAARSTPPPHLAVVDLSGGDYTQALQSAAAAHPSAGPPGAVIVAPPGAPFSDLADATRRLKPYLAGDLRTPSGQRLDAVAIVHGTRDSPLLDLWTRNIAESVLEARLRAGLAEAERHVRLEHAGLSAGAIAALDAPPPQVATFSPRSQAGRVSLRDRLPGIVGFGMGIMLWSVILTGAGILLNSVIEEKSTRILEVLLTSASAPEIMGGKILGAAGVTASALAVWLTVGGVTLFNSQPAIAADVFDVLLSHGLLAYFALYFLGGYLMYATLFTTIGAFCETAREAQTLLGPLMILLSIPVVIMGQAITHPDSPLLQTLSWVPPFTPFLMAARAASGPPLWQVAGTAALMFAVTGLEMWVAGRAFRTGALSSGRFDVRLLLASLAGKGEA
ncbi:MAG: ABC transporter permease [Caulobacterales bacterium]